MPIITVTTIAPTIEHAESGASCVGGHCFTSHITDLRATAVFCYTAIVDGNINIPAKRICTIDATTIKLTYKGVVDFESDPVFDFVISCTCYDSKLSSIGVTMWCCLVIGSCYLRTIYA